MDEFYDKKIILQYAVKKKAERRPGNHVDSQRGIETDED